MEHVNTVPNNTGNLKTRVVEKIPKVFTGVGKIEGFSASNSS
jgi:hypothetical protein